MPEPLRSEITELLRWKQAKFAPGRPQRARNRAVTAKLLDKFIARVYGYAVNIGGFPNITSLRELLTEQVITSFVEWSLNERNVSSCSIMRLSSVYSAVRFHPKYQHDDWRWLSNLFSQLPLDDESALLERKARKYVPYGLLCKVPSQIREIRVSKRCNPKRVSRLVHDALLISWLTVLPWRQRNIRECRLGATETANIFFDELPAVIHVARPKWVEAALQLNPKQRFWQFAFRENETKMGGIVRGIIPRRLIPPLEDYLENHRPKLVAPNDPGTLFLNRDGHALTQTAVTELVAQLVLKHAGRRVTPHLFRDIFAYAWLDDHPEDYLTLSKILWHRDIKTTLKIYGRQFDESNGARRIDEWLAEG